MPEPRRQPISDAELQVLKALWDHGPKTVREVVDLMTGHGQEWTGAPAPPQPRPRAGGAAPRGPPAAPAAEEGGRGGKQKGRPPLRPPPREQRDDRGPR